MRENGKIYVVGIGPGSLEHMTGKALHALQDSDIIVGYKTYIKLVEKLLKDKEILSSGMKKEIERCELSLEKAMEGKTVSLISSGDAGVYGMAGVMIQLKLERGSTVPIEIVPGITAASAAASLLGAPLTHDFAVISLSDLLTDWGLIKKRIEMAALADFTISFYNPKSNGRVIQIAEAREILLKYRNPRTPVGIVRNAKRDDEQVVLTDLENMLNYPIDMLTVVIVGNSNSFIQEGFMVTPRGYAL